MHDIKKVAVIGAGVSGVCTATHLKEAGLEVTVFERSAKAGGVWVFDERTALEPAYPSVVPSVGDSPEYAEHLQHNQNSQVVENREKRQDSPLSNEVEDARLDLALLHAPPGPCYASLKNNVSTVEMKVQTNDWPPGTEEFVSHRILAEYIQDTARRSGIEPLIRFGTRVNSVEKTGSQWTVKTSHIDDSRQPSRLSQFSETFDAVVVASGHYHACNVPDTPGLSEWKQRWPDRIWHSKRYRNPKGFENQNVLIVGSGVSSWDIAKDIAPIAKNIYQVSRGGAYDLPASVFPPNTTRIGDIAAYEPIDEHTSLASDEPLPGTIRLKSGHRICNIHQIILCTGYHMSYPFLPTYHADTSDPADADDKVLVTKDGQRTHNLHRDIFYIPDPTLAFIGVPYHVATFSCFDFQGLAVAAVYSGRSSLPTESSMRHEYDERIAQKGSGRAFHSLKGYGDEIRYVNGLMEIVNQNADSTGRARHGGHSETWRKAYEVRVERLKAKLGAVAPQEDRSLDEILDGSAGTCV